MLSWSTFQATVIYDEVLKKVCATFRIEAFEEEQQKAIDMFFEGNTASVSLPTGYGKSLINLATPVINRLSSLEKIVRYIYCAAS